MFKKIILMVGIILSLRQLYSQELRGTWIARDQLGTKEALAQAIDSIAAANFNVVYVNVWSRGYPLWKSNVFYQHTGVYIDPTYEGRDILAEAIAEAHKHGLHVEAWFEYGFVGGYEPYYPGSSGKGKIFDRYPHWVAKRLDGGEKDNSQFYWMVQTRKDVQDFLIALVMEIVRNYDVDGLELDRIRYSSLQYGYDSYTDSLYRLENNGNPPPTNYSEPNWIRWRANKLNEFQARVYDSVKSVRPKFNLSNAPSLYSATQYTSYNNFCQDWVWWVNNNKIDNVQVQSYVESPASFGSILDFIQTMVNDKSKVYPAFAVNPGGNPLQPQVVYQFIDVTRNKGFKGNSIWYSNDLKNYFQGIKANRYQQKTHPPFSSPDWRDYKQIVKLSDQTNAIRFGNWSTSLIPGYEGQTIFTTGGDSASVSYYFDVPISGYYDVYAFVVPAPDQSNSVEYIVRDSSDNFSSVIVDQTDVFNKRWKKLKTVYLSKGRNLVLILSNRGVESGKKVRADAAFIKLNRILSPNVTTSVEDESKDFNHNIYNPKIFNFPNPFNSSTTVEFLIEPSQSFNFSLYNYLGQKIYSYDGVSNLDGKYQIKIDSTNLSSGIYFCSVTSENVRLSSKLLLIK
ncbi:MAG: family 10 glycosylhydrolase [Ignavibacteria bacterium]|nr:family 10 glycosylhydrolase [Ignavibacteria bacterium]